MIKAKIIKVKSILNKETMANNSNYHDNDDDNNGNNKNQNLAIV